MLSASEIAEALDPDAPQDGRLTVVPRPDVEDLRKRGGTSIDLRLGRWFKSFKQTRTNSVSLAGFDEPTGEGGEMSRTRQHFVPFGDSYVLHPGRFVLGATLEWLRLPAGLSGYVTGKSSLGRHGLVIETAAGMHPHFSGCLTLELANVGEVPLEIFPGMKICQIFLHRTTPSAQSSLGAFSGRRKPGLSSPRADDILRKLRDHE
ncbi:MAG: dCTP deaminase [Phenylobacterium sp.]|uniref:dCTP deaminase n=1 Tax=Phenylobacterium sp. TaxID=1871053 RepID=UPI0011F5F07A|nr:dCTP deaminase [Phenylobacterium sp.]TAJ68731.1 MAG: dCTP deaminase [Phenylobacterium sp.]